MLELNSALVDVQWLQENLHDENLVVLDASVEPVVPGYVSLNTVSNFRAIPGARFFDYDTKICKPNSSLPHMMPEADLFEKEVRELGLNKNSIVVVYDDVGIYASPRAWWMLKAMGHEQVAVLDGGLPAWIDAGLQTSTQLMDSAGPGNFTAIENEDAFCDFSVVLKSLEDPACRILDARGAPRFNGIAPEPRPGVRSGHMPNAKNLPFPEVLNGSKMKSATELKTVFTELLSDEQRLITSCGSGLTACILTLAAHLAGHANLSVYDGSWSEWGQPGKLPVVTA